MNPEIFYTEHMIPPEDRKTGRHIKYIIIGTAIVLLILFCLLVINYRALRRAQILNTRGIWFSLVLKNHGSLPVTDVSFIRPWMTFDYVNKLFNVPSDYLATHLSITDARYPRLSLSQYAKTNHFDSTFVTSEVESAVGHYLAASTTTNFVTSTPK
jgi:hypothetical protein